MFDFEASKKFNGRNILSVELRWEKRWSAERVWDAARENGASLPGGNQIIAQMPSDTEERPYTWKELVKLEKRRGSIDTQTEEVRA